MVVSLDLAGGAALLALSGADEATGRERRMYGRGCGSLLAWLGFGIQLPDTFATAKTAPV